jgi:colicin import membrane protein
MAGSAGTPVDTGVAPKASAPSASYIGRLRAKVKPNITFPDNLLQNVVGNPTAEVEVICSPSGKIEDVNLLKPSGNKAWDDAVVNGLYKTDMLPRDVDGSVPTRLVFSFRPRGD